YRPAPRRSGSQKPYRRRGRQAARVSGGHSGGLPGRGCPRRSALRRPAGAPDPASSARRSSRPSAAPATREGCVDGPGPAPPRGRLPENPRGRPPLRRSGSSPRGWRPRCGPPAHRRRGVARTSRSALDEGAQALGAARVAELAQRLGLDLADTLTGHLEVLTDLLEGVIALRADAEAHAQDLLLTRGEGGQHLPGLLGEVHVDDRVRGAHEALVLDEVAQVAVLFLADRRLERDGLLGDLEDLADLLERELHLLRDLLRGGLAADLLHQVAAGADELVDGLDHVDRDADGPRLVGDRAGDGLTDPPRRVGAELVAALVLELVHGLHEADVALLDQVQELQTTVRVLLGDGDHQAQVGLDQLGLGALGVALSGADGLVVAAQILDAEVALLLDALDGADRGADV